MFGKIALAAAAVIAGVTALTVDMRQQYDEMYPVNTLQRDAFNICRDSDPTFIRARQVDRVGCFDRMSHDFAMAIGWISPSVRAAQASIRPGGFPTAEMLLAGVWSLPPSGNVGPRQYTGIGGATRIGIDCASPAAQPVAATAGSKPGMPAAGRPELLQPKDRIAAAQDPAMAALGLKPGGAVRQPKAAGQALPVLPLNRPGHAGQAANGGKGAPPVDALPSADLNDPLSFAVAPPSEGCREPA